MSTDINFGSLMLAADALKSTGLADLGYTYVNIGENYLLCKTLDRFYGKDM